MLDSAGYEIDFGAEKIVAATKDNRKIAVEVKSFLTISLAYEFHRVLGQYLNYRTFLGLKESDRMLYLAISQNANEEFFKQESTKLILETFEVKLLVFEPENQTIESWIEK